MASTLAKGSDESEIDAIFSEIDQSQLLSAAVGIAIGRRAALSRGFGLANMELPTLLVPGCGCALARPPSTMPASITCCWSGTALRSRRSVWQIWFASSAGERYRGPSRGGFMRKPRLRTVAEHRPLKLALEVTGVLMRELAGYAWSTDV